jgi:hypothetical protein
MYKRTVPWKQEMCVFPDMYITTIDVSIKYVIHIMVCYEKICPNCDCERTVFLLLFMHNTVKGRNLFIAVCIEAVNGWSLFITV